MIWLLNNQKLLLAQQEMGNTFVVRDESSTHSYLQSGRGSVGGRVGARQKPACLHTEMDAVGTGHGQLKPHTWKLTAIMRAEAIVTAKDW